MTAPAAPATAPARPSRAARRRRRSRRVGRVLLVLVLAVLTGLSSFVGGLLSAPAAFDLPPAPRPALLLADDGTTRLSAILPAERREPVAADQIPQVLRAAVIAAEDSRFLEHRGVDPLATVRAAFRDLTGGRTQGGSTLTQQYVKNVYVGDERTLLRKAREAALAVRLERRLTKDEILVDYLNVLYLGNGSYGVQAASEYYFAVPVRDLALDRETGRRSPALELARAAMLAGIAPAPSVWNPVADREAARARQRYTLNRMVVGGAITPEEASRAFETRLDVARALPEEPVSAAPEFTDVLEARVRAQYTDRRQDELFRGGLRVTSTLDGDLQDALRRALRSVLPDADDPQAAAVAVDIDSGDVKAMTTLRRMPRRVYEGGAVRMAVRGHRTGGFNLATQGFRSAGSTIKPFTLAVALQQGLELDDERPAPGPCDTVPRRRGADGTAQPSTAQPSTARPYTYCNAGRAPGRGPVTLREALAASINTVYVPLALEVGRARIRDLMLAAGAEVPAPTRTRPEAFSAEEASFGLGTTAEVTPLSLASAYATLMNEGVHVPPRFATEVRAGGAGTDPGRPVERAPTRPEGRRVLPASVARDVVAAMSDVTGPSGTAERARQPFPVHGKTGTTDNSTNAWFVGCAYEPVGVCLAVWMGYEDQECAPGVDGPCGGMRDVHGVEEVTGGTLPAEVFARTFDELRARRGASAGVG